MMTKFTLPIALNIRKLKPSKRNRYALRYSLYCWPTIQMKESLNQCESNVKKNWFLNPKLYLRFKCLMKCNNLLDPMSVNISEIFLWKFYSKASLVETSTERIDNSKLCGLKWWNWIYSVELAIWYVTLKITCRLFARKYFRFSDFFSVGDT